jgi:hypothetical protein
VTSNGKLLDYFDDCGKLGAEPFLVTTEKYEGQARNLLTGTFNQIKPHLRIIHWNDVVRLYQHAREINDIEKKLRLNKESP